MKKSILSLLLSAISICGFAQRTPVNDTKNNVEATQPAGKNTKIDVDVTVSCKSEKNLVDGIVPVGFLIKNNMKQEISLSIIYPNSPEPKFDAQPSLEKKRQQSVIIDARTIPTIIPSGGTYEMIYFLNKYFYFFREGTFEISYALDLEIDINLKRVTKEYNGKFLVDLKKHSSMEELKEQYAYYSNQLKSNDKKLRREAAEALSYTGNLSCLNYVTPMLSIKGLEVNVINILSHYNNNKTQELISGMLSHEDILVVVAAQNALISMGVKVPKSKENQFILNGVEQ